MSEENKKVLLFSFITAAFIVWLVTQILIDIFAAWIGVFARVMDNHIIRHGIPLLMAAVAFGILQFHPKVYTWADEVIVELRKVVWPSKKDTAAMTFVVLIMILISGVILGLFDLFTGYLVKLIF